MKNGKNKKNNNDNNDNDLAKIIEALLLAAGKVMTTKEIMAIFAENERPDAKELAAAIEYLQQQNSNRGIELIKVANGYQFVTKKQYSHLISKLWQEKPSKYSRALLETLALIAYKQPITRGEIEQIRGVAISTSIFKTLQEERGWIRVIGHKDVPGKPGLYATTKDFLTYFGLDKLEQLPPLPQIAEMLAAEDGPAIDDIAVDEVIVPQIETAETEEEVENIEKAEKID